MNRHIFGCFSHFEKQSATSNSPKRKRHTSSSLPYCSFLKIEENPIKQELSFFAVSLFCVLVSPHTYFSKTRKILQNIQNFLDFLLDSFHQIHFFLHMNALWCVVMETEVSGVGFFGVFGGKRFFSSVYIFQFLFWFYYSISENCHVALQSNTEVTFKYLIF